MSRKSKFKDNASVAQARGVARDVRFSIESLKDSGGVADAASWITRRALKSTASAFETVLRDLSSTSDVFALLLASNSTLRELVTGSLLQPDHRCFNPIPWTKESYLESVHAVVLVALHQFLSGLSPPRELDSTKYTSEMHRIAATHRRLQEITLPEELSPIEQSSPSTHSSPLRHTHPYDYYDEYSEAYSSFGEGKSEAPEEENYYITVHNLLESQRRSLNYVLEEILSSPAMGRRIREMVLKVIEAPMDLPLPTAAAPPVTEILPSPEDIETVESLGGVVDAFPRISPGKAKVLFDSPEGWGLWHLFLSSNAIKDLRTFHRAHQSIYKIIQKKLKELSDGFFSKSNQKYLVGGPTDVHFFEAKLTSDLRLVYRIELHTDEELLVDRQVLYIYGIFTHAKLDKRFWTQVAHHHPRSDSEYRQRCEFRSRPIKGGATVENVVPPMEWPHQDYAISVKPAPIGFTEEEFLELHKICSLEKFIPFSRSVLQSILADVDVVHRFAVSSTETKIINHDSSCFVVGRSGTGKTTTMVFKILGVELAIRQNPQAYGAPRLRQMFITQSHVLARRVEDYYKQLAHAANFTSLEGTGSAQLDEDLLDMDEENDERVDLPSKFSELEDKHFPLFVTFDQLRRMLETDLGISFSRQSVQGHRSSTRLTAASAPLGATGLPLDLVDSVFLDSKGDESFTMPKRHFVSFNIFVSDFWPHFDQKLTKGLDPALVFSEIMGVILGHETIAESEAGALTREGYLSLSHRAHSSLFAHRDSIYTISEKYRRMKYATGMFDSSDRTHAILRELPSANLGIVDFLYVDEVQDLRIMDTKLLQQLCRNPHGMFWGGDTAQTISVGSSFRFEELKDLMYHEETMHPHVLAQLRAAVHPATFQLLVNYRSHGGIVDCAASLIELLASKFPGSIDKLQRETALVTGPKPVVFRSDIVPFEEFIGHEGEARLDFGAQQVILVRDEDARYKLRRLLGGSGLILTLLESKGLEFDDVLLYDFFASSPASPAQWRIVNTKIVRDIDKHRTIESELKRLYVAITRARHHCWIWESTEVAIPMLDYWAAHDLARLHLPGAPIPTLATKSTPEEWYKTGRELFGRKLYHQAASSFDKAGRPQERLICEAYEARAGAKNKDAYLAVAGLFKAVACEPSSMSRRLFKAAAECFRDGGDFSSAADCYVSAHEYTEGARLYRRAGDFTNAVKLVKPGHGEVSQVDPAVQRAIIAVAKFEFVRRNDLKQAAKVFDDDVEEQLEFMELYGFHAAKTSLYKIVGNFEAAGELHQQAGEVEQAVKCFLRSEHRHVRRRAIPGVLDRLRSMSFQCKLTDESVALLRLLDNLSQEDFASDENTQITIFRAIAGSDAPQLRVLAKQHQHNHYHRVLCQDQSLLYSQTKLDTLTLPSLLNELAYLSSYFGSLSAITRFSGNLCHQENGAFLFGIHRADGPEYEHLMDHFTVKRASYLGQAYHRMARRPEPLDDQMSDVILPAGEMDQLARKTVAAQLRASLSTLHSQLSHLTVLDPCLDFTVRGSCDRMNCDRDHTAVKLPNHAALYVRAILQVIQVLNGLFNLPIEDENQFRLLQDIRIFWIRRFFDSVHPLNQRSSCATAHRGASDQENRVLQEWISQMLFELQPDFRGRNNYVFLSDAMMLSSLACDVHDWVMPNWVGRTQLFIPREDLVRKDSSYSIVMDIVSSQDRLRAERSRVFRGILALRHLAQNGNVSVDAHVLVVFLEHLALEIIVTVRQNRNAGPDGLILPRSWVQRALKGPPRPPADNPRLGILFEAVYDLMRRLFTWAGDGPFLLRRKQFPQASLPRHVLLARICRSLVLIGLNGPRAVQQDILRTITYSLRSEKNMGHSFTYAKYAAARTWHDLLNALYDSSRPSDHDHLVALCYRRRMLNPPRNVRVVVFDAQDDIFKVLDAQLEGAPQVRAVDHIAEHAEDPLHTSGEGAAHNLEPSTLSTQSDPAKLESAAPAEPQEDRNPEDITEVQNDEDAERDDDLVLPNQIVADENMERLPTEEEHVAASLVQRWYRAALRDRSKPRDPLLAKNLASCIEDIGNIQTSTIFLDRRRAYTAVVRGPLPHALCALDRILTGTVHVKSGLSKKVLAVKHEKLEATLEEMDYLVNTIKTARKLRKAMGPCSPDFRSGDILKLKLLVADALNFAEDTKGRISLDNLALHSLEGDIRLAYRGIVQPRAIPAAALTKEKPDLNVEDLCE